MPKQSKIKTKTPKNKLPPPTLSKAKNVKQKRPPRKIKDKTPSKDRRLPATLSIKEKTPKDSKPPKTIIQKTPGRIKKKTPPTFDDEIPKTKIKHKKPK